MLTSTMVKTTQKKRLQMYCAKDIDLKSLECKSVLLSNTSKHLQKVVTSLLILIIPTSHTEKTGDNGYDGPAETMDEIMDLHIDADTNPGCADFKHPASLCIQTRAKHYQNLVCGPYILN